MRKIVDEVGVSVEDDTPAALEKAVLRALARLQQEPMLPEDAARRLTLTEALQSIQVERERRTSTELVPLTPHDLVEVVSAAVKASSPTSSPEEKLRKGAHVARTQSRKDFRNGRVWPFAGIGTVAAFLWSQRATFGIDLTGIDPLMVATGAGVILSGSAIWLLMSWTATRTDEWFIRKMFDTTTHLDVLEQVANNGVFTLSNFRSHLWDRAVSRRRVPGRRSPLSVVDLEGALEEATDLAIERFVNLGSVIPVKSLSGLKYKVADDFLSEVPDRSVG